MPFEPNKNNTASLCLTVEKDRVAAFLPLLAQGFTIKIKTGSNVRDLLSSQIGLSDEYLEHRVQTIFLDGKAVDNIGRAVVRQNSTLALSAAMPGLAGATLRRRGPYAAMRHQITHVNNAENEIVENGTIVLKLFNLVAGDIGPMFLRQGVWINGKGLYNFFQKASDHLWAGCRAAEIDGRRREVDKLAVLDWHHRQVFLKLTVE